ncbi:MAG: GNAT family N-acetyltransferase [Flavobacteriaceae bacterium]
MAKITKASVSDLPKLIPLFDQYRIFYKQPSDLKAAELFLQELFRLKECVVFLAEQDQQAAGFTLLYKTYSSVSMKPYFILNDLYVAPVFRQAGIGSMLLEKTQEYCKSLSYKGLALETAVDNPAQKLYEKLGWQKDSHCFHYFWHAK